MQKGLSTLFLFSSSLLTQCLTQPDFNAVFIFLFNRGTNELNYCSTFSTLIILAISFSNILYKTLKFEITGT